MNYYANCYFLPVALLQLRETHNALRLPVFFFLSLSFLFFCQPCLELWNCKLIFMILKITQYGRPRRWIQLFPRYSCKNWYKNWYLHFHKTYDYQIWQTGTFREVDVNETNQTGDGDVITSRSRDKLKQLYLHYHNANLAEWLLILWGPFP